MQDPKLRGGYYTPDALAAFLADWATADGATTILEPSAGDGALVRAILAASPTASVHAVELIPEEAAKVAALDTDRVTVAVGDAFTTLGGDAVGGYDAVVGNPPFIRYQNFPEAHRDAGFAIMRAEGLKPTRLTNAWVPFVVLAARALRPGGRLALILPAELMQVSYSGELRDYLARTFGELVVITFEDLVFPGIQQETILLMATKALAPGAAKIAFAELSNADDLHPQSVSDAPRVEIDLEHGREKWTQYYLSPAELGLIRALESSDVLVPIGSMADVNVGIVTGRNDFFVLRPSEAKSLGLEAWCVPLVGRSAQIPGVQLGHGDWQALYDADGKCLLLQLGRTPRQELSPAALEYVVSGEALGFDQGYKCRIRLPEWWFVPSDWVPDAFMLRQVHDAPRIIANQAGAVSTDTIHRVRTKPGINPAWLAAASVNSATFAFSEIRGRSYGGGVLELEPSEAQGLPMPRPGLMLPPDEIDHLVRARRLEEALDEVDRLTLMAAGVTRAEILALRGIWGRLSARRSGRKAVLAGNDVPELAIAE